jgi:hypothetical protein
MSEALTEASPFDKAIYDELAARYHDDARAARYHMGGVVTSTPRHAGKSWVLAAMEKHTEVARTLGRLSASWQSLNEASYVFSKEINRTLACEAAAQPWKLLPAERLAAAAWLRQRARQRPAAAVLQLAARQEDVLGEQRHPQRGTW